MLTKIVLAAALAIGTADNNLSFLRGGRQHAFRAKILHRLGHLRVHALNSIPGVPPPFYPENPLCGAVLPGGRRSRHIAYFFTTGQSILGACQLAGAPTRFTTQQIKVADHASVADMGWRT